jgi:hypothetical protein
MKFNIKGFEDMLDKGQTFIEGYGNIDDSYEFYNYLWNEYEDGDSRIVTQFGKVQPLDQESSYDEGDQMMTLTFSIDDRIFLQKSGFYSSWGEATRWDGQLIEVEPYQEVVTKYRKKK